jgi:predicted Zn finger-like uncharacterized protein
MAAQYKTQCPHCSAQFRISEQHLEQAKGQVRCGSCLKVFLATDHLVAPPQAKKPASTPAPAAPAQKATAAPTPETWTLPSDDTPASAPSSRWTMDDALPSSTEDDIDDSFDDFSDEEIEDAVSKQASNDTSVSIGSIELSDSFMSLEGDDDERLSSESFSDMSGAARATQSEDSDESWAEKLLEELEDEKPVAAPVSAATMKLSATEEEAAKAAAKSNKREKILKAQQAANRAPEPIEQDWSQEASGLFDEGTFGLLDGDDDLGGEITAIELPKAEKRSVAQTLKINHLVSNTTDLLRWAALSALLCALFVVQYLTFNFNELARTPEWRGFYTTVCGAFGCPLPSPSDVTRLHGANLVVRKHPTFSNALVVDVLLVNKASYQQPFPIIELGFTNLQGSSIASRRFVPDEYLQGDLTGHNTMPINQPVHISLEILDPGEDAVNYTVRFFPTPQAG